MSRNSFPFSRDDYGQSSNYPSHGRTPGYDSKSNESYGVKGQPSYSNEVEDVLRRIGSNTFPNSNNRSGASSSSYGTNLTYGGKSVPTNDKYFTTPNMSRQFPNSSYGSLPHNRSRENYYSGSSSTVQTDDTSLLANLPSHLQEPFKQFLASNPNGLNTGLNTSNPASLVSAGLGGNLLPFNGLTNTSTTTNTMNLAPFNALNSLAANPFLAAALNPSLLGMGGLGLAGLLPGALGGFPSAVPGQAGNESFWTGLDLRLLSQMTTNPLILQQLLQLQQLQQLQAQQQLTSTAQQQPSLTFPQTSKPVSSQAPSQPSSSGLITSTSSNLSSFPRSSSDSSSTYRIGSSGLPSAIRSDPMNLKPATSTTSLPLSSGTQPLPSLASLPSHHSAISSTAPFYLPGEKEDLQSKPSGPEVSGDSKATVSISPASQTKPSSLSLNVDWNLADLSQVVEAATRSIKANAHIIARNMVCRVNGLPFPQQEEILHTISNGKTPDSTDIKVKSEETANETGNNKSLSTNPTTNVIESVRSTSSDGLYFHKASDKQTSGSSIEAKVEEPTSDPRDMSEDENDVTIGEEEGEEDADDRSLRSSSSSVVEEVVRPQKFGGTKKSQKRNRTSLSIENEERSSASKKRRRSISGNKETEADHQKDENENEDYSEEGDDDIDTEREIEEVIEEEEEEEEERPLQRLTRSREKAVQHRQDLTEGILSLPSKATTRDWREFPSQPFQDHHSLQFQAFPTTQVMSPSASPAPSSGGSSIIEDAVDFEAEDRGAGSGEDYYGSVALVPPVTCDPPNDHRITFFCWDTVLADVMKTSNKHPLHVTVLPSDEWLRIFEGRKLLNAFELSVLKQQWVEKELEKVVFQLILFAKQQNKKDDSHYKQVFGWNYLKEQMRLGRSSMLMTIYWCSYVIFLFHHPKYQGLKMTLEQFRSHYLRDSHWFDQLSEQSSSIEKRRGRRRKADREISLRQTATEPEEWSEEDEERLGQEEEQTEAEEEELLRRNSSTGTNTTSSSIVTTMCGGVSKSVTFKDLFEGLDELEIRRLCQFRNVLRLAFLVIPAYRNEILLLKVAAVLERSGKRYPITTSGQLLPTTRRRMIYRREAETDVWTREQF